MVAILQCFIGWPSEILVTEVVKPVSGQRLPKETEMEFPPREANLLGRYDMLDGKKESEILCVHVDPNKSGRTD
jgi:hypothetical protein